MGFIDSVLSAFGGLRSLSDEALEGKYEELRLKWLATQNISKADSLRNEMHRYDAEMTRRANEAYKRDNPNAQARHREHGWYLDNDD